MRHRIVVVIATTLLLLLALWIAAGLMVRHEATALPVSRLAMYPMLAVILSSGYLLSLRAPERLDPVPSALSAVALSTMAAAVLSGLRLRTGGLALVLLCAVLAFAAGMHAGQLRAGVRQMLHGPGRGRVPRAVLAAAASANLIGLLTVTAIWISGPCTAENLARAAAVCVAVFALRATAGRGTAFIQCALAAALALGWSVALSTISASPGIVEPGLFVAALLVGGAIADRTNDDSTRAYAYLATLAVLATAVFAIAQDGTPGNLPGTLPHLELVALSGVLLATAGNRCRALGRHVSRPAPSGLDDRLAAWTRVAYLFMAYVVTGTTWMTGAPWGMLVVGVLLLAAGAVATTLAGGPPAVAPAP